AEDGIRDRTVTGVQTCALPISTEGTAASGTATVGALFGGLITYSRSFDVDGSRRVVQARAIAATSAAKSSFRFSIPSPTTNNTKIGRASCRERVWLEVGDEEDE